MSEILQNIEIILISALRASTPIILAAIGGLFCAKSGVMAMGLESFMLVSAFGAAWGSYVTQNPWFGLIIGVFSGVLMSILFAILAVSFSVNQVICGVGLNLLASGLTAILTELVWGNRAYSEIVPTLPIVKLPILGEISWFIPLTLIIAFSSWIVIFKTPQGLRLRIVGEDPVAAKTIGIDVKKYKYSGVLIAGFLSGLAGSYLSIHQINRFVGEMTAGRGYIAMAVNVLGKYNPLGAVAGGFLFGLATSIQNVTTRSEIHGRLLLMIPYLVTVIVLSLSVKHAQAPAGMGKTGDNGG